MKNSKALQFLAQNPLDINQNLNLVYETMQKNLRCQIAYSNFILKSKKNARFAKNRNFGTKKFYHDQVQRHPPNSGSGTRISDKENGRM